MKNKSIFVLVVAFFISALGISPAHATGGAVTGTLSLPTGVTFDASASQTVWLANNPDQGNIELALPGFNTNTGMTFDITINGTSYNQQTGDLNNWIGDCSAPNDSVKCLYIEITSQGDLTGTTTTVSGSISYTSTFDFTDVIADFAAIGLTVLQSDLENMVQTQEEENYSHFYVTLSNNTSNPVNFVVDEFKVNGVTTTQRSSGHVTMAAGETGNWFNLGYLPGNLYYGLDNAPLALTVTQYQFAAVAAGSASLPAGITVTAHQPEWWEYNSGENKTCVALKISNSTSTAMTLATKPLTLTVGGSTVSNTYVDYVYIPARGSGYYWQDNCISGDIRYNSTITLGGSLTKVTGPKLVNKIKLPSGYTAKMTVNNLGYDRIARKTYIGVQFSGVGNTSNVALRFSSLKLNGKKLSNEMVVGSYEAENGSYTFGFTIDTQAGDLRLGKTFTLEGKVEKQSKTPLRLTFTTSGLNQNTGSYVYPVENFEYDAKKNLTTVTIDLWNSASTTATFNLSRLAVKTQIKKKSGKWDVVKTYSSVTRTATVAANGGKSVVLAKIPGDLRSDWKTLLVTGAISSTVAP